MFAINNPRRKHSVIQVVKAVLHAVKKSASFVWAKLGNFGLMLLGILLSIFHILLALLQLRWYKAIIFWRNQLGAARIAGSLVTLASFLACIYGLNILLTPMSGLLDESSVLSSFVMWPFAIFGSCLVVVLCLVLGSIVASWFPDSRKGNTARLEEKQTHVRQQLQENRQKIKAVFQVSKAPSLPVFQAAKQRVMEHLQQKAPRRYQEVLAVLPNVAYSPDCKQIIEAYFTLINGKLTIYGNDAYPTFLYYFLWAVAEAKGEPHRYADEVFWELGFNPYEVATNAIMRSLSPGSLQ